MAVGSPSLLAVVCHLNLIQFTMLTILSIFTCVLQKFHITAQNRVRFAACGWLQSTNLLSEMIAKLTSVIIFANSNNAQEVFSPATKKCFSNAIVIFTHLFNHENRVQLTLAITVNPVCCDNVMQKSYVERSSYYYIYAHAIAQSQ